MQDTLKQAVLVVAHPDDEILWFSSLVAKIRKVVICYLGQPSIPKWTVGRQQTLAQYPLQHVFSPELDVAEVFGLGDWYSPGINQYGMVLHRAGERRRKYRDNYHRLINELPQLLAEAPIVITHNPWGEYGHEEHVQVFRAVRTLQQSLGFALLVPNYVSRRSFRLMMQAMPFMAERLLNLPTDIETAHQIRDLYHQNECWTWKDDYQWPERESFLEISLQPVEGAEEWNSVPLNFLNMGEAVPPPLRARVARMIYNKINRFSKFTL